jgi:prepilin peptidase CpaA
MSHIATIALLIAAVAAGFDLRTHRIPNLLTLGGAAIAVLFHVVTGGVSGGGDAIVGWLIGAGFFLIPYQLGGLGAGDVKLVAAIGAWLGPESALWLGIYTAIAGGGIALVAAAATGYLRKAFSNIWLLLMHWTVMGITPLSGVTLETSRGPRVAYGVAILFGTVGTLWFR